MTTEYNELRRLAERASVGPWYCIPHPTERGADCRIDNTPVVPWENFGQIAYAHPRDAEFIAAANPAAILELLTALESAEATIAAKDAEIEADERNLCILTDALADASKENEALRQEVEALRGLLQVAACPANCIGGAYHGHDGEPVQCRFCYERSMLTPPTKETGQ